ncbi:unnamed protein product [Gadus morhua 'NCC']
MDYLGSQHISPSRPLHGLVLNKPLLAVVFQEEEPGLRRDGSTLTALETAVFVAVSQRPRSTCLGSGSPHRGDAADLVFTPQAPRL